jgi:oxaloacetate decarboxylase gamma subunit
MNIEDLLLAGAELMLLGMGIVFGFLIILVFTLKGMSWLADQLDSSPQAAGQAAGPAATLPVFADDTALIAVISAAVSRYRNARLKS